MEISELNTADVGSETREPEIAAELPHESRRQVVSRTLRAEIRTTFRGKTDVGYGILGASSWIDLEQQNYDEVVQEEEGAGRPFSLDEIREFVKRRVAYRMAGGTSEHHERAAG